MNAAADEVPAPDRMRGGPDAGGEDPRARRPGADPEIWDVVIVGAGLAGLTAAEALRHRRVLVLEHQDRVGGRLRSERRGRYWLNHGAHLFGGPQTPVGALIERCGLEARPVTGSFTAVAMEGRLLRRGTPARMLARMPLSLRGRIALASAGARILRGSRAYRAFAAPRDGETPADLNRRLNSFMNDRSFAQLLGRLPPDIDSFFRAISNRAQAAPEDLAAGGALSAFALVFASDAALGRNVIGGAGQLIEALSAQHRATVETRARVTSVTAPGRLVRVTYTSASGVREVSARTAIVTAPPATAAEIIGDLPADTAAALNEIRFGPSVVMSLLTDEVSSVPWDGIYAAVVPGRSFNMFFNQADVLRDGVGRRERGGSLMVYASGELGRRLADEPDRVVEERFLRDLHAVFPETRSIVKETVITRWPYATAYPHVGRARLQEALDRPLGPIALAGDYLGAWFTDSAVLTAQDAARYVEARLAAAPLDGAVADTRCS